MVLTIAQFYLAAPAGEQIPYSEFKSFVAEAFVGKNLVMKRFASRARGRSSRILKPFSEITIVVREAGEAA